jgi:hypothetical protein
MRRIEVSPVSPAPDRKPPLVRRTAIPAMLARPVEAFYDSDAPLVKCTDQNALAQAAHDAFYEHRPLVVTPDAVWFCLAQGFALHVNQNVETLRSRFVKHQGKVKLVVEREDFFLGQPNPWPEAFAAFSDQVAGHVGKLRDLVAGTFSTTGPLERAAFDVLVMDTFQGYFEYEMSIGCGIPAVYLAGTVDDWRSVRTRAAVLGEYGLERWTRGLLPVLDRIVASAEGRDETQFWRSFFRYDSGSGPAVLTGWINVLFPYLKQNGALVENTAVHDWESQFQRVTKEGFNFGNMREIRGPWLGALPAGLASAPVHIIDVRDQSEVDVRFVAGMFGVVEDPSTSGLAPEFGWAIVYEPATQS